MNQSLPKPLQAYIALTAIVGGALLGYWVYGAAWDLATVGEAVLFFLLVVIAGSFPLPVASNVKTDVTTAVLFGAALVLEPGVAALTGALGIVTYTFFRLHLPWYKYPFNAGATAIYVGLASVVFHALSTDEVVLTVAVVPAAVIMYGLNTALVTGAATLQMGGNPLRFWWMGTRENWPAELGLLAFGFLGAVVYRENPWTVVALFIPVAIIYIAFSRLAHTNTELEDAMKALKALQGRIANDAKLASVGALYLDMAHQIKNPLTFVIGRIEKVRSQAQEGSEAQRLLDIALKAAWHIQDSTENFLSVGQRGGVQIDVSTLLNDALGMAGILYPTKIETRLEQSEEGLSISGNPVLLRESLTNIFSNAIEATKENGLISVIVSLDEEVVLLRISDNGVGIPKEMMEHLFEPFQSTKPNGTGLGRFACKHILDMHNGSVEIENEEGQGTTVTVRIPAGPSQNGYRAEGLQGDSDILTRGSLQ